MIGAILLVLPLVQVISTTVAQSPCPNYFYYYRDEKTNDLMGWISIPQPPKDVTLHLVVHFSIATAIPTNYVGRLQLARSKEESIRAVEAGNSLTYKIHFPVRQPIPLLTKLLFNEQEYCVGPKAIGSIVTSIELEHTLFPPRMISLAQDGPVPIPNPSNNSISRLPNLNLVPSVKPDSTPYTGTGNAFPIVKPGEETCGLPNAKSINLLIAKGDKVLPGRWPWLVAIFLVKIEFEFQCAGSLITEKHVISAAHCFELSDESDVPASTLLVSLGRNKLRNWREQGSVNLEVSEIKIHSDHVRGGYGGADSDIAILVLRERVVFTPLIQPVCLWKGPIDLNSVVGKTGYVVGWGRDEEGNKYTAEPRMARVPIVSQEVCLRSNEGFLKSTSNRTLCAGSRDGSGPCNGDSGSGLVLRDPNTGRYHLRGVVSLSLFNSATNTCDWSQYVVYVDVAKYLVWIRKQIEST
ncbi:serine protease gd isoform X1 [Cephus cinctus]|uniref:Serine protease gd isoform X1 n=1 Tax=Cephus cinctus TaxID=211228 RepID=A0AAJ7RFH7_CEPCN|nr:serine protease gd isoform X1 [Cephus cinctus]XP_015592752.1 serine protease gd isoform X1 [Cephus cinctus]XP_024939938.1 serine protease gd isoform X1 [Cephus cinctus]